MKNKIEWFPVAERMPPENMVVLVFTPNPKVLIEPRDEETKTRLEKASTITCDWNENNCFSGNYGEPTHWAFLPESPKT